MKYKFLCTILAAILFLSLTVTAYASNDLLVDYADLLTLEEETELSKTLDRVSDEMEMDVVVLTVDSLDGETPEEFAENYYDSNGYADTGVLLLVSMEERDWYICTTGDIVVDEESLSERFVPALSEGNYLEAFQSFARNLDAYTMSTDVGGWLIAVVVGVIVAFIVVFTMKAQLKSVRSQPAANSYIVNGSFNLTHSRDIYLFRNVTRTPKPQNNGSSSGRKHGGGGGKF